jgi:hypothetical protein
VKWPIRPASVVKATAVGGFPFDAIAEGLLRVIVPAIVFGATSLGIAARSRLAWASGVALSAIIILTATKVAFEETFMQALIVAPGSLIVAWAVLTSLALSWRAHWLRPDEP